MGESVMENLSEGAIDQAKFLLDCIGCDVWTREQAGYSRELERQGKQSHRHRRRIEHWNRRTGFYR
jgi:hypothetical protein